MEDSWLVKYDTIYQKLIEAYGEPTWRPHLPPIDELVSTILSQATSDTNRDKGFDRLKEAFPDWESVMDAPTEEVIDAVRPAGLANQKGPRIQNALHHVYEARGALSLDFLAEAPLAKAQAWLTDIKGVGPKTAAVILLFAFGRPAFPVDTHVHRVTQRLGLIEEGTSANKAHEIFEQVDRPDTFYAMHLNLIRHGREICKARRPRCEICPLQAECDYYQEMKEA